MRADPVLRLGDGVSLPVTRRFLAVAPPLLALLLLSAALALTIGSTPVGAADIWAALVRPVAALEDGARAVALLRLPRVGAALLAGAMTAAAGYLLQVVSRNGLADPGILGISNGTSVAVLAAGLLFAPRPEILGLVALGGAMATAAAVLALGRHLLSTGGIILVGVSVNILLGAVAEIIMVSGDMTRFSQIMTWSSGSLGGVSRADLTLLAGWAAPLLPALLLAGRFMAPLALGDEAARALGVNTRLVSALYLLLAAALVAPVVTVCGPLSFLGLIAAYIARRLVGERPMEVLVTAMGVGACVLLWADTAGRTLFQPMMVPAGLVVAVVGVLVFLLAARLAPGERER